MWTSHAGDGLIAQYLTDNFDFEHKTLCLPLSQHHHSTISSDVIGCTEEWLINIQKPCSLYYK
jgi:hypothetical protein